MSLTVGMRLRPILPEHASSGKFCRALLSKPWNGFPMSLAEYRVATDLFAGPMDLLLYLVRRHEVDVCQLRLSEVTSHFLDYLDVLEMVDYEMVGDFVVLGSTLLEIKSREVLPKVEEEQDEEQEEEQSSDLVARLLEYRRYKDAAHQLELRADEWLERFPRIAPSKPPAERPQVVQRIREVEVWDLVSALARIIRMPDIQKTIAVRMDETPMSVHQERIRTRLVEEGRVSFSSFFDNEKLQSRIVGIFLAILELIRHEGYRAEQPVDYDEIWILPPLEQRPD